MAGPAGQSTTQLQASGHRYLLRRLERALLHGDVRPAVQPVRVRSALAFGGLLAAVLTAGSALLGVARPEPAPGPVADAGGSAGPARSSAGSTP